MSAGPSFSGPPMSASAALVPSNAQKAVTLSQLPMRSLRFTLATRPPNLVVPTPVAQSSDIQELQDAMSNYQFIADPIIANPNQPPPTKAERAIGFKRFSEALLSFTSMIMAGKVKGACIFMPAPYNSLITFQFQSADNIENSVKVVMSRSDLSLRNFLRKFKVTFESIDDSNQSVGKYGGDPITSQQLKAMRKDESDDIQLIFEGKFRVLSFLDALREVEYMKEYPKLFCTSPFTHAVRTRAAINMTEHTNG